MHTREMKIADSSVQFESNHRAVYESLLPLREAKILELGCGKAEITRDIVRSFPDAKITALEVDRIQHQKNLNLDYLPNLQFELGSAEDIHKPDAAFDVVLMFRSLHHVPVAKMDRALAEIRRVLKPGGLAYFEELVFAGEYNAMISVFHNEQRVREAAFAALRRAVEAGDMDLVEEKFFLAPKRFRNFAELEAKIRGETHTSHDLSVEQFSMVKERFMQLMRPDGVLFQMPMRVDLLRRPLSRN